MYLFAEVLANIRQANLFISLSRDDAEDTRLEISADRNKVTVFNDTEIANIYLPTGIVGNTQAVLPTGRWTDTSLRLELIDSSDPPWSPATFGDEGPWSAKDMSPGAGIRCRGCKSQILDVDRICGFKDLPSDQWAEMMDLWHCHRPTDNHPPGLDDTEKAAASKGYGASNQVAASVGTVFISHTAFLLAPQDCQNFQSEPEFLHISTGVDETSLPDDFLGTHYGLFHRHGTRWTSKGTLKTDLAQELSGKAQCSCCKLVLGTFDPSINGMWLSKSSLSVRPTSRSEWEVYPPEIFISAQLLSILESSAARKVVAHAGEEAQGGLLLWILNPDIHYSSSRRKESLVRAIKIFFREVDEPQKVLDEHQASVEELQLEIASYNRLKEVLHISSDLLPPTARKFKEWTIGLLDRCEAKRKDQVSPCQSLLGREIDA